MGQWNVPRFPWFRDDEWMYIRVGARGVTRYVGISRFVGCTQHNLEDVAIADTWSSRVVSR